VSRECVVCGEGQNSEKGTPMYYDERDDYAHPECARKAGFNKGE